MRLAVLVLVCTILVCFACASLQQAQAPVLEVPEVYDDTRIVQEAARIAVAVLNDGECKAYFDREFGPADHSAALQMFFGVHASAVGATILEEPGLIFINSSYAARWFPHTMAGVIIHEYAHHLIGEHGQAAELKSQEAEAACHDQAELFDEWSEL